MDRLPVTLTDRYQLLEVVGRGGMGEVWSARDLRLGRPVAVKVLNSQVAADAGVRERFEIEARSAARLNHPNVVSVFDSGEHDGVPYLVMELLPGRSLADELALGPLEPDRVRQLGAEVLAALSASHQAGIIHRDIKPGNVLLTAAGRAKVGDFGIAKSTEGLNLTSTGMIVGTAAYLAPERVNGEPATAQSDLYAVGVLLYEALSGRKPFEADTPMGMLRAVEQHEVIPLAEACPGLDAGLVDTVERSMAKDPAHRFASAEQMAESLQGLRSSPAQSEPVALDAAFGPTEALSARPATRVLSPPSRLGGTVGRTPHVAPSRWAGLREHLSLIAVVAIVALFVLIVAISTQRSSPQATTTAPSTLAPSAPTVSVPAGLDAAIRHLEQAVRP